MAFYGERFHHKDEEDIWKQLKQMLLNPASDEEIALNKHQEQAKIDLALEKMFPSVAKPQADPYLNYEDLFDKSKTFVNKTTNMATSQKPLDGFGQNVLNGLNTNKNIFPGLGKITQKPLNNNSMQNNTTPNQNLTWQEKAFDKLLKDENIVRKAYPVSADMYVDARTDFSRAKADKNATVLENMNSLDSKTQEALKKYGVKPNERGVYYNADSDVSKKFGKSRELKEAFDKNYQNIKDGNFKGDDLNFDATIFDAIANKDKFDRHSSIQHAKLHKAHIDKKGKKHAEILDKLDYVKRPDGTIKDKIKNYPNNHGYNLQEKGALENYFTVMDVIIEDDDWLNKLRKKLGL